MNIRGTGKKAASNASALFNIWNGPVQFPRQSFIRSSGGSYRLDSATSLLDSQTLKLRVDMTPEQRSALAVFLRQHLRNLADIQTLRATLELSCQRGFVPLDWEQKLEAFGQTPHYRAMLEDFEPLIVQFEQSGSETALIELLQKTLKGRLVK
jgi:hypothetical protein